MKLLNGPLAGRELHLPEGAFHIGDAGSEADLFLPLGRGGTAELAVTDQGVRLCSPTPCWVRGRPVPPGPLPMQTFIDLDGVYWLWGSAETPLPTPKAVSRWRRRILTGGVALGLLLAGLAVGWGHHPGRPAPPALVFPATVPGEPGLRLQSLRANTIQLTGTCRDSVALGRWLARWRAQGVHLQRETVCVDEIQQAVQALLQSYGYADAQVQVGPSGRVQLDGALQEDNRFAELVKALAAIPGVQSLQVTDHVAASYQVLLSALQATRSVSGVSIRHQPQGWLLSGALSSPQQMRLLQTLHSLERQGNWPDTWSFVPTVDTTGGQQYLSAPLAGVAGPEDALTLLLQSGQRLQVGNAVLGGMHIVAITPTGVSLSNDRQLIFLPLQP